MTKAPDTPRPEDPSSHTVKDAENKREERKGAALRDNLRRRKAKPDQKKGD